MLQALLGCEAIQRVIAPGTPIWRERRRTVVGYANFATSKIKHISAMTLKSFTYACMVF